MINKIISKTKRNLQAGFTLLEMLMVLVIFGIITAIVSFNYGAFNNQIVLGNLAYEIAMQIREAQVFSLGVRGSDGDFNDQYGVYFVAGSNSFISFIDQDGDGQCGDGVNSCDCDGPADECQKAISLPRNIIIDSFRDKQELSVEGPIHITFKRPDPEAIIISSSDEDIDPGVDIIIKSPDNQYKKILVRQNGYISVSSYEQD